MDSHISDESGSVPEEMPMQSKEPDSILPPITPKDDSLDQSHCKPVLSQVKPVFAPVDIGVLYEEEEEDVPWILEGYLAEGGWTLLAGPDLPGQIRSRVNVRLDRNQGGQSHAQETVYGRGDYSTSADG